MTKQEFKGWAEKEIKITIECLKKGIFVFEDVKSCDYAFNVYDTGKELKFEDELDEIMGGKLWDEAMSLCHQNYNNLQ